MANTNNPLTYPAMVEVRLVKSDQRLHWFFEDPAAFAGSDEECMAKFRQVRDLIEKRIIAWVKQFRA